MPTDRVIENRRSWPYFDVVGMWGLIMRYLWVSAVCLGLAACGTPQQQCVGAVTRDLRVVDGFIAEAQGNLARGYDYVSATRMIPRFVDCTPDPTKRNPNPASQSCRVDTAQVYQVPVAIDLDAEAAKLASLQAKRAALASAAAPAILTCQQQYPE
ncbi:MAG: hypothetical protein H7245_09380 [Candidatus Saccharibacteria bacterium]|nr:hypothetical protein [Pseudorhodobacter sp.]